MYEQFNQQFLTFSKTAADNLIKANAVVVEGFEKIFNTQLKAAEERLNANAAFIAEASEVRDMEAAKTVWPKGMNLARENAEKAYGVAQEVFGLGVKTSEELGKLAKDNVELAQEAAAEATAKATKKASK